MPLTRTVHVESRPIRVYDDLVALPHISQLTDAFMGANFVRDEVARPETAEYRHWALNIPLDTANQLAVYQPTLDAVRDFEDGDRYRIYRSYCNHAAYGDMLFTHTDAQPGRKGLTALWYIAPEWNVEWGGETLFYNSNQDAEVAVTPKPGRLVVFDGSIVHAGRPPNRICYAPRYTLALKLEPSGQ
ncbi:MAG TPA: 2OG-Fe(II) oxygenase [Rhodanobacteraceae bacterium]|nr:2OG-Fe(II) oxygenase [Rhodanobacteraceae bacterium]